MEELKAHVPDQTLKINRLIDCFVEDKKNSSWVTFRNSVWGIASASEPSEWQGLEVQQEVGMDIDVDATGGGKPTGAAPSARPVVKLPETLPHMWGFDSSHILVRSEYEEAEKAALVAIKGHADAFLVIGQSGIGPSFSLILMRRSQPLTRKISLFGLASRPTSFTRASHCAADS